MGKEVGKRNFRMIRLRGNGMHLEGNGIRKTRRSRGEVKKVCQN